MELCLSHWPLHLLFKIFNRGRSLCGLFCSVLANLKVDSRSIKIRSRNSTSSSCHPRRQYHQTLIVDDSKLLRSAFMNGQAQPPHQLWSIQCSICTRKKNLSLAQAGIEPVLGIQEEEVLALDLLLNPAIEVFEGWFGIVIYCSYPELVELKEEAFKAKNKTLLRVKRSWARKEVCKVQTRRKTFFS